jgi:hypothetical protein
VKNNPSIVRAICNLWGLSPEEVPTSDKEESDWFVRFGELRVLIEEKTKFDDPAYLSARDKILETGEIFESAHSLAPNNRISAIAKKSASQLRSTGADVSHDVKLMWFTARGATASARFHQVNSTLYGLTNVFELGKSEMRRCYFFYDSTFFRFKNDLDGAVIGCLRGTEIELKLCMNPYSARSRLLKSSPLINYLKNAVEDPLADEENGFCYIADTDIDRKYPDQVLDYIAKKYDLKMAQYINLSSISGTIRMGPP